MAKITIDVSCSSIVLTCSSCSAWFAFADTQEQAHDSAVGHEKRTHTGETDAYSARKEWRARERRKAAATRR